MNPRLALTAVLVAGFAGALSGCGASCTEVAASRERVAKKLAGPIAEAAHLQVRVPLDAINDSIAAALEQGPVMVPVELPAPRGLPLPGTRADLRVRSLRLEPTARGHLRFSVRAAVSVLGASVFHFSAVADAEPRVIRRGQATYVELHIGLGDVAAFRPRLPSDAADRIVSAFLANVARVVRDRLPRTVVRALGNQALGHIAEVGVRSLMGAIEDWLGTRARIRLRMPKLPIASVAVASDRRGEGALLASVRTTLPVAEGIAGELPDVADPSAITVALSADTAMAVANWAIETGLAPQRYNRDLEPQADGRYRPLFQWRSDDDERPLAIHLFRTSAPCSYVRVGFLPTVELRGDNVVVHFADRRIEEAQGPTTLEVGARLSNLLGLSLEKTREIAGSMSFEVGELKASTRTRGITMAADTLVFELEARVDVAPDAT